MRDNPELDAAFFGEAPTTMPLPKARRQRKVKRDRDAVRRRAFKVLALLADLDAESRSAVLKAAERLNRG